MAVSMQRLQISGARILVMPIDVVHLDPVVMLEEQPTVATTPLLGFEQPGQSWIGVGMPSLPRTWLGKSVFGDGRHAGALSSMARLARPPSGLDPVFWHVASDSWLYLPEYRPDVRLS